MHEYCSTKSLLLFHLFPIKIPKYITIQIEKAVRLKMCYLEYRILDLIVNSYEGNC